MNSVWSLRAPRSGNSSAMGSFTLQTRSADDQTSSAVVDDLRSGPDEVGVGHGGAVARPLLHVDRVSGGGELAHTRGRQRHPLLVGLYLAGDADDHRYSSMLLITCLIRV